MEFVLLGIEPRETITGIVSGSATSVFIKAVSV